jgi:hypothetical protein
MRHLQLQKSFHCNAFNLFLKMLRPIFLFFKKSSRNGFFWELKYGHFK